MYLLSGILEECDRLKIRDIKIFNAEGVSTLADYFIIATSDSTVQMEAIRSRLIEYLRDYKIRLKNPIEDWRGGWCLMDFGNIIINVMMDEMRSFYNLESLFEGAGYKKMERIPVVNP